MSGPIISVSRMRILEGGLELLKEFTRESVAFFEANEPRVTGICLFINADGTSAYGIQIHPDSESYENHLEVAASQTRAAARREAFDYVEGLSWDIFGTPGDSLLRKLEAFGETMTIVPLEAGFVRTETAATTSDEPIMTVSRMRILEGGLELLKEFTRESVAFFEANEPRMIGICLFINADGTEARSIQIHPDSDSYENHLEVAASQIHEAYNYIEGVSFDVFGTPSDSLREKLAGYGETMNIVPLEAGFVRSPSG